MKEVIFVRHGQTTANVGRFTQTADTPLTELGLAQADDVAARLKDLPIELIVVSEMHRAQQTAAAFKKTINVPQITSPFFNERRNAKRYDNLPHEHPEVVAAHEEWWDNFGKEGYQQEEAETYFDLCERARAGLSWLLERPEETILVVTHGMFLRFLVAAAIFEEELTPAIGKRMWHHLRTANTGITIIDFNEGIWRVKVWNDHSHVTFN